MTRTLIRAGSILAFLVMVIAMLLLAKTTQNTEAFSRMHFFIVVLNVGGCLLLLGLIFANLVRLVRDYLNGIPGARLKSRMIGMFALLAAVPLVLVYLFSMYFLNRGINSYFDDDVTAGLNDALKLSQTVLELQMDEHMNNVVQLTSGMSRWPNEEINGQVNSVRAGLKANALTFYDGENRVFASSVMGDNVDGEPERLDAGWLMRLREGENLLDLEPGAGGALHIRAARLMRARTPMTHDRIVYARFPVSTDIAQLADSVQRSFSHHRNLEFSREPLIDSFKLTLTLVLLVSLLMTLWGIFFIARRIVKPIQDLVAGTRAVAEGDFHMQLPMAKKDDIGFLVQSFNDMTLRLSRASEIETRSRAAVEAERANLETILSNLSSGVLAVEPDFKLRSVNEAGCDILAISAAQCEGEELTALHSGNIIAGALADECIKHLQAGRASWRKQLGIETDSGQHVLSCACTPLPMDDEGRPSGYVVVFDDVTPVVQAQRERAWGEVARRLAHEIKNPLTPIQLSAERMRRRYLGEMNAHESDVLERATRTIVQQVETMRDMVDAFRDYARAPDIDLTEFDLNRLIHEIVDLYRGGDPHVALQVELDATLSSVIADSGRIRQILHNLLRNSLEALHEAPSGSLLVRTKARNYKNLPVAEIVIEDDGPGFPETMMRTMFEPYVTSKPKGTGLGLAIVKKLVEEHAGVIHIENRESGGAYIQLLLPRDNQARTAMQGSTGEETRRESA